MAISDEIRIVDLNVRDVDAGLALSCEAGWNQTVDDWRHFIRYGSTIGVRDDQGRLVASAAALPYDGDFGFVAMVLVTPDWRRRGIATVLVNRCVRHLEHLGLTPVLDATSAGEEVYRKQDFVTQFRFDRWERKSAEGDTAAMPPEPMDAPDPALIKQLDCDAFGAARPALMDDFLKRPGTIVLFSKSDQGFAMMRRGRLALQAGPLVAPSEHVALPLMARLVGSVRDAVFIDVPAIWQETGSWLAESGFVIQRSFARMALRRSLPFGNPQRLFAVAGPEFG